MLLARHPFALHCWLSSSIYKVCLLHNLSLLLQILSCVMASLGSAEDLCRCLMVNQQLLTAVQSARMSLNLTDRPRQLLSFPARPGCLDQLVHSLTRYMPGKMRRIGHSDVVTVICSCQGMIAWAACKKPIWLLPPGMMPPPRRDAERSL